MGLIYKRCYFSPFFEAADTRTDKRNFNKNNIFSNFNKTNLIIQ